MNRKVLFLAFLPALASMLGAESVYYTGSEIEHIPIYRPFPGMVSRYTDGQMVVGAKELQKENRSLYGGFLKAFREAKSRAEQEVVLKSDINRAIDEAFQRSNAVRAEELSRPENARFLTSKLDAISIAQAEAKALEASDYKQAFVEFPGWGENPIRKTPAKSWEDLRESKEDSLYILLDRTPTDMLPPAAKAEAYDRFQEVFRNGPDTNADPTKRLSKLVNLQDAPYWRWNAGLIPSYDGVNAKRRKGFNVHYINGPAYGIAAYLQRSSMWIILGFPCHGNPIIPFLEPPYFLTTPEAVVPHEIRSCTISPVNITLKNRGESATFTLSTNPEVNWGGVIVDWYVQHKGGINDWTPQNVHGNTLTVSGMQLDEENIPQKVLAQVTQGGDKPIRCSADITLQGPPKEAFLPAKVSQLSCPANCKYLSGPNKEMKIGNFKSLTFTVDYSNINPNWQYKDVQWLLQLPDGRQVQLFKFTADNPWQYQLMDYEFPSLDGKTIETGKYGVWFKVNLMINGQICPIMCFYPFKIKGGGCGKWCMVGIYAAGVGTGVLLDRYGLPHGGPKLPTPPTPTPTPSKPTYPVVQPPAQTPPAPPVVTPPVVTPPAPIPTKTDGTPVQRD